MTQTSARQADSKKLGAAAEAYFCKLLRQTGYAVLERNYAIYHVGELDLIANRGNLLLCVEVKARSIHTVDNLAEFSAEQAVDRRKLLRMQRCMQHYLHDHAFLQHETRYLLAVYYVNKQGDLLFTDIVPCE